MMLAVRAPQSQPPSVAFEGDRWDGDSGAAGELRFQVVVACLALGQAKPPAVVVDHDVGMVRVVERRGAPVERRIVEVPLR